MTFRGLLPFFGALVGVAIMFVSFSSGISAALNGGGAGSAFWQVLFVVAGLGVLATIILSIVKIVRKRDVVIAVATLFVGVVPLVAVVVLGVLASQVATR